MANDEIKVTVCKYPDRENLVLRYVDPTTGKQKTRTAGTSDESKAIGAAAVWEDELRSGRYQAPSKLTWAEFRKRYETEKLTTLAPATQKAAGDALDYIERIINPDRLAKLTAAAISRFQSELRKPRKATRGNEIVTLPAIKDTTVARHLRHIKAALSWGVSMGMLAKTPKIEMPKRSKGAKLMKGRPITAEEFDRILVAVPKVRPNDTHTWERLLRGLWLSGLRLGEAVALSWDQESSFQADLTGKRPAFRILGEAQKSGRDEILPMTPDFATFLTEVPETERVGPVFKLVRERGGKPMGISKVGAILARIGKKANVVVNKADGKFASAHDLRRAFGTRWAKRVMPAVLKRLMRHSAIQTTMNYYVDLDAADVADQLWADWGANAKGQGNISGNIARNGIDASCSESDAIACKEKA